MRIIDTRYTEKYSPLIPAMYAIDHYKDEELSIVLNDEKAFKDLKEYLSEQNIGFREIYNGEEMALQFIVKEDD
jgi:hypothetical protein